MGRVFGEIGSSMIDGSIDPRVCWVIVLDVGATRISGEIEDGPYVAGNVVARQSLETLQHMVISEGARLVEMISKTSGTSKMAEIIMCASPLLCWDEGM